MGLWRLKDELCALGVDLPHRSISISLTYSDNIMCSYKRRLILAASNQIDTNNNNDNNNVVLLRVTLCCDYWLGLDRKLEIKANGQ